jgi:hypothetical protein
MFEKSSVPFSPLSADVDFVQQTYANAAVVVSIKAGKRAIKRAFISILFVYKNDS